ncbi:hypothetical protein [Pseudomonas asiatica]|uniref:Uncharacterized protein n=1 Tax=Pseudomonas asiatica TaxID=2219225 RepID=A0ABU5L4Q9_9PSED|nr:hypothetical protein [Pseudomonas asiatica]MDZ5741152.1 hypothetical protein [Pseudomonas asiatica]MDZ5744750.1 hypothetical protein [Pseudomonas asiatica]MDZ5751352.1 hypothetical protein [Pseudomonas asiatica]MDZ5756524.1 hypothetical protein [Pseudomonas asiatica]
MTDTSKMPNDLPTMVKQAITGHPGYSEFAAWCESQLIHPYPIYFLIWQASREAVVVELPEVEVDMIDQVGGEQEVRYYPKRALIAAVEAQGLKVAP